METGTRNRGDTVAPSAVLPRADILAKVADIEEQLDGLEGADELRASVQAIQKATSQPQATKHGLKDKVIEALMMAGATEGVQAAALGLLQMLTLLG